MNKTPSYETTINMPTIKLDECKHGHGYWIDARQLCYGVFDKNSKGFIGIRTKFGNRYLFTEYHWDTGAPFGTANPKILDEKCQIENLNEDNKELFDWIQNKISETPHDKTAINSVKIHNERFSRKQNEK